jgi:hypothetical protein
MDLDALIKIIEEAETRGGIKTSQIRSAYKKETGKMPSLEDEEKALIQLREERKIRFETEPWRGYCYVVTYDYKWEQKDYHDAKKRIECMLFWS